MNLRILIISLLVLLAGCSTSEKLDLATPEGGFARAQKLEKDERYEEAIAQYAQVKNKHPYSNFATESDLKIADIYFKREDFVEAQNAYLTFKELHPTYAQIAYVTYRLALSYANQLPPSIDRDLSLANKALLYLDEVIATFAKSEYAEPAAEQKRKILKMLAEKENYVAHFYFIREKFDSALGRYEDLLQTYPDLGLDAKALYGAAVSAHRLKDAPKAEKYLSQLMSKFPGSKEANRATEEFKDGK